MSKTPLLNFEGYKQYLSAENHNHPRWGSEDNFHYVFNFPNKYGASIIKHRGSYGYEEDLFELAVLAFDSGKWGLTYNTPLTDDVLGCLSNEEVLETLEKIKNLEGGTRDE